MFYRTLFRIVTALVVSTTVRPSVASVAFAASEATKAEVDHETMEFAIGGCGGAYFSATSGELTIDVQKRDRNHRGRTTELRAILVGPDRAVLDEAVIPDDGRPRGSGLGPVQYVRLSTTVKRKGIFGLNITVSGDRYGDDVVWGFRTNCPKYLIETSRGHRDERHQEPIVLFNPDHAGDVCFVPRTSQFKIEVTGLPKTVRELSVFDGAGTLVQEMNPDAQGSAQCAFTADARRGVLPWRLHLPAQQAVIQIDGVTRWDPGDHFSNLSCWTPDSQSYFPFLDYRWLLTPYHKTIHGKPGENGQIRFRVHNNSHEETTVKLSIEFPEQPWAVRLSSDHVELAPGRATEVTATYTVPSAGERICHIRATPQECRDVSTYSTLTVSAGQPLAAKPVDIPIMLRPYQHENELFGYLPDYPVQSQMYFDLANRPYVRSGGSVATLRGSKWQTTDLRSAIKFFDPNLQSESVGMSSSKIAFDRDNDMYVLGSAGRQAVLLHSADDGRTFAVYVIPGREGKPRTFDIEQFSGHNVPDGPPPIVRFTRTGTDSRLRWRRVNDLDLILPRKDADGRIVFDDPVFISDSCIGLSAHSGIPSSVVSRNGRVHVAWGAATDPAKKVPGVPAYVSTYDRKTRELSEPALIGYGPPANDVHNSPSITIDGQGYLHALGGTHGQPFPYARSLKPNDASAGWTEPETVGEGRQTYIGLICGADGTLHSVFRMWRYGEKPHPASYHATLAYQRKRPGQRWEKPRVLITAPFSEYSIFYHRLTIDRKGRLFLSYDYWSTYWFYRTDHYGDRRALLMSPDEGDTWKLVETRDLLDAI